MTGHADWPAFPARRAAPATPAARWSLNVLDRDFLLFFAAVPI